MTVAREVAAVSSDGITEALRGHYPTTAYAFFEQVPRGTGWSKNRLLDVVVMSLWPSRGLDLTGIEIKVTRGDFRREINDPAKADEIGKFCDLFFIAAPKGLLEPEELPATWGLLEIDEKHRVRARSPATRNTERQEPTRGFVAALLRRASEAEAARMKTWASPEQLEARVAELLERAVKSKVADLACETESLRREVASFREAAEEFEKASGHSILNRSYYSRKWEWMRVGELMRAASLLSGRGFDLAGLHGNVQRASEAIAKARELLAPLDESDDDANTTGHAARGGES